MALLDELTETLIPADEHSGGARAAGVAPTLDAWLSEFDPTIPELREAMERWKAGLASIDRLSRDTLGKGLLEASADERIDVLQKVAAAEHDPKTEAERFFTRLKESTVWAYYTSRLGIHDELEYEGNVALGEFVGTDVATLPRINRPQGPDRPKT